MKGKSKLDYLRTGQLLKKDSAPWSNQIPEQIMRAAGG
jgi:hypothetical protein